MLLHVIRHDRTKNIPANKHLPMTHKTKGIILRTVKYGETSLVVTIFTELFGVQSYMVNGIRTEKKGGQKAAMFQPASILDLEVYHNPLRQMHRIKEFSWAIIYEHVLSNVIKNSIALFMVELINKTLKQPEQHTDLFYFCEDALIQLDQADKKIAANFPLYFSLHLSHFFGLRINEQALPQHDSEKLFLDLQEGCLVLEQPLHPHVMHGKDVLITLELLKVMQPVELADISLNRETRRELLMKYQQFFALHIPEFGEMKTLKILHEVL